MVRYTVSASGASPNGNSAGDSPSEADAERRNSPFDLDGEPLPEAELEWKESPYGPYGEPPKYVKDLDLQHQKAMADDDPAEFSPLSDDVVNAILEHYPKAKQKHEAVLAHMNNPDKGLSPDNPEPYAWAWRQLIQWQPSYLVIGLVSYAVVWLLRRLIVAVHSRAGSAGVAGMFASVDMGLTIGLLWVVGPALLLWALYSPQRHSDAPARTLVPALLVSSTIIPSAAALTASGAPVSGIVAGIAGRSVALLGCFLPWKDLNEELLSMYALYRVPLALAVFVWSRIVIVCVVAFGSALRVLALIDINNFPLRDVMESRALRIRLFLGETFPTSFSLCRDTGGLIFGSGLTLFLAVVYLVYVCVFATDLGKVRWHRHADTILTKLLAKTRLYMPRYPADMRQRFSTAPDKERSFFASDVMLMREHNFDSSSASMVTTNRDTPRIFQLMQEEEAVMAKENMKRWVPPPEELIPLTDGLTWSERSMNALERWAQPMPPGDEKRTFDEYFDTLESETEYTYDPETEKWVFTDVSFSDDSTISAEDLGLSESSSTEPDQGVTSSKQADGTPRPGTHMDGHPETIV